MPRYLRPRGGHRPHRGGGGPHRDRRTKRKYSRSDRERAARKDQEEQ